MAAEVRGSDLNSWWENRAAYRNKTIAEAEGWRAAGARFRRASENAQPGGVAISPGDSLAMVTSRGDAAIQSMQSTAAQISALAEERAGVEAEFASEEENIRQASAGRVHRERQEKHQQAYENSVRAAKAAVFVRKCCGLAVFGLTAYLLLRY